MNVYTQKEKWSGASMAATIVCIVVMGGVAWLDYAIDETTGRVVALLLGGIVVVMCGLALWLLPLSIAVDDRVLAVRFAMRYRQFPLREMANVEACPRRMKLLRIFGNGGMFGYWGWYRTAGGCKAFVYAANLNRLIRVEMDSGRTYLLSCSDPEALVAEIEKRRKNHKK